MSMPESTKYEIIVHLPGGHPQTINIVIGVRMMTKPAALPEASSLALAITKDFDLLSR